MAVTLFGGFELRVADRVVPVGSRRVRALLAALAVRAGHEVPLDRLVDLVFQERPPARPRPSMQTLATRLRTLTGPGLVRAGSDGYLLDLPPDAVDVLRFERLIRDARTADPVKARALLAEAMELWRGDPLSGCGSDTLAREVMPRLVERYLSAVERRVDLDLELALDDPAPGRFGDGLVGELRDLLSAHPMREPLWARLVTVLHRSGRSAEALQSYETIRARLAEQLGTDPSAELRRAFQAVLSDEDGTPAAAPPPPVPRQLPSRVGGFTGRAAELAALDGLIDAPVVGLHGTAGVGKTALALQWAHRVADRFPDGQIHLDLRGYGPDDPVEPADALDIVLRAVGVPPDRIPSTMEERSALLRTTLAGRRTLLLLDNAREPGQVRPLLPGAGHLVLVTSRHDLRGLAVRDAAVLRDLHELPAGESAALLATVLGADRAAAEPAAVSELAMLCGHLPLALVVAGQRAARFPTVPLAELVDDLRGTRNRLDRLADSTDPAVDPRAVLSWSYRALGAAPARAFRLLGLHPAATFGLPVAAALLGAGPEEARRLLETLVSVHLLEQDHPTRYRFHDLLRAYAAERAAEESAPERDAAAVRMLDWYLHTLYRARVAAFAMPPLDVGPLGHDSVRPLDFEGLGEAAAWYDGNHRTLPAVVEYAAAHGYDRHGWRLADLLRHFQDLRHHQDAALRTAELAVDCVERMDDDAARFRAWHAMGAVHNDAGRRREAEDWLHRALGLAERNGDHDMVALACSTLGLVHQRHGDLLTAIDWLERSVIEARRSGRTQRLAHSLLNLGVAEGDAMRTEASIRHNLEALELYRGLGATYHQALALGNLSEAHLDVGDHAAALAAAGEALALLGDVEDHTATAGTLIAQGRAYRLAGRPGEAHVSWQRALRILRRAGDPRAGEVRALLSGLEPPQAG